MLSATNFSGITLSSHTSSQVYKNKTGIPSGILYRMIIDSADSLLEASAFLKNNPRTMSNNLLVSSLSENSVVVYEITADTVVTRKNGNFIAATNHFVSDDLRPEKISRNSKKRYFTLRDFYETSKNITLQSVQDIMSSYDQNKSGWSALSNNGTVQSVIFLPAEKKCILRKEQRCQSHQKDMWNMNMENKY